MKPRDLRARVNLTYEEMSTPFDWGPSEKVRLAHLGNVAQKP